MMIMRLLINGNNGLMDNELMEMDLKDYKF
jgi:hypothetical protein